MNLDYIIKYFNKLLILSNIVGATFHIWWVGGMRRGVGYKATRMRIDTHWWTMRVIHRHWCGITIFFNKTHFCKFGIIKKVILFRWQ